MRWGLKRRLCDGEGVGVWILFCVLYNYLEGGA